MKSKFSQDHVVKLKREIEMKDKIIPLSEKVIVFPKGKNIVRVKDYCPVVHVKNVKEAVERAEKRLKEKTEVGTKWYRLGFHKFIEKIWEEEFGDFMKTKPPSKEEILERERIMDEEIENDKR